MHAHSLMRSPSVPALYYPSSYSVLLHFLHIWCGFHCVFRAFLISKTCMQYFRSAYPCIFYHASAHSIPFTPLPFRRGFCMFCWWYVSLYFSVYSIKFFTPWVPGRIPYGGGRGVSACVALYMTQSISQKIAVSPLLRMHFFYHGVTHALPLLGYTVFSLCIYSLGFFLLVLTICYPLGWALCNTALLITSLQRSGCIPRSFPS